MLEKHRLLSIIIGMILIPVLLGTTPMNMVQMLSSPLPQSLDKQIERSSSCLFNSIAAQHDFGDLTLNSDLFEWKSAHSIQINLDDLVSSYISLAAVILRC